jgi:hypothetical protein
VLKNAGRHVTWWYELFSRLAGDQGWLLLYDLTTIFTYSGSMNLAERGLQPDHQYIDQIGVIWRVAPRRPWPEVEAYFKHDQLTKEMQVKRIRANYLAHYLRSVFGQM